MLFFPQIKILKNCKLAFKHKDVSLETLKIYKSEVTWLKVEKLFISLVGLLIGYVGLVYLQDMRG